MTTTARILAAIACMAAAMNLNPRPASACGGFFCGQQPVDQTAERIIFAANENGTTTMIVQISYRGAAADFAWVLPLADVPERGSFATFPQLALVGLDAQTGPQFQYPDECAVFDAAAESGPPRAGGMMDGDVTVHIREQVGPFESVVIESTNPQSLIDWLRMNQFRVNSAMEPYIGTYTSEGMKFLALRLVDGHEVTEIEPFRLTLPGTSPSIPLRLTAIAAEPEMGVLVFILGDMRYGPANWSEVEIDDNQIVWKPYTWPLETNWTSLVARAVDEVDGRGFATELAGSTSQYVELLRNSQPSDPEQIAARDALLALMEPHPYITRLYTRLSPEEMTSDPIFRRTGGVDVARTRTLPRYSPDGVDYCGSGSGGGAPEDATTPCDFMACGAGGYCGVVAMADGQETAGCACVPGATARTTFDPAGRATVTCQDMRMSFVQPGDRPTPDATPLPDPCVGFDCGSGRCVAINMTPTCVCDSGLVAVGSFAMDGSRVTRCTTPINPVPATFYLGRLPERPDTLPGGMIVDVPTPMLRAAGGGGCSVASGPMSTSHVSGALLALMGIVIAARRRRSA